MPADNMLLFYKGRQLLDHQKLSDAKIEDGHDIHVQPARDYRAAHLGCTPYCLRKHKHVARQPWPDDVPPSRGRTSVRETKIGAPICGDALQPRAVFGEVLSRGAEKQEA